MRLKQLLAIFCGLMLAAPAAARTPYERAMAPYLAALHRQCPGRDLEDLSLGDLNLIMEGFDERLASAQKQSVARQVRLECRHSIAGLGCANTGALLAYERLGVLPRFVSQVCATSWRCTAFADCRQTGR